MIGEEGCLTVHENKYNITESLNAFVRIKKEMKFYLM